MYNAMLRDERYDSNLLRTKVGVVLLETLLVVAHLSRWVPRKAAVASSWTRHPHWVNRWWRCWSVRSAGRSRVVLRSAPAESNSRVTNRIALHLIDGHFGSVSLDELDEAATLARRNLDVCYLAKSLEERSQLILGDVSREATHEDSSVVRVSELIHRLLTAVLATHWWIIHGARARARTGTRAAAVSHVPTLRTTVRTAVRASVTAVTATAWHAHCHVRGTTLVFWCSGRDSHGSVAAVDTLHLAESALLVGFVGEPNEAIASRHAGKWIGHDLGGLARWEPALEERDKDVFVDLGTEITHENAVFRSSVVSTISEATTTSPIELERSA